MKKIILWVACFTVFGWCYLELQESVKQEHINNELKSQNSIDSLHLHIDSLQNELYELIDTMQYEYIDTTVIHWPWGREEFYYFKYKDAHNPEDILNALIHVESRGNDSAYCAEEDAVGCLQIRRCMIDDVNRILKRQGSIKKYTYKDRWSRIKSIEVFNIVCKYYKWNTLEKIARCWNGGPRGINNPATVGYWEKVKDKINS